VRGQRTRLKDCWVNSEGRGHFQQKEKVGRAAHLGFKF